MAEPDKKSDSKPVEQPSSASTSNRETEDTSPSGGAADLRASEDSAESGEPEPSFYKPSNQPEDAGGLKEQEELPDNPDSMYREPGPDTAPSSFFRRFSWRITRRKALAGGGVLGTIIALLFFFNFASG